MDTTTSRLPQPDPSGMRPSTVPRTLVEQVEPWQFAQGLGRTKLGGRTAAPYVSRETPNVRRDLARAFASP